MSNSIEFVPGRLYRFHISHSHLVLFDFYINLENDETSLYGMLRRKLLSGEVALCVRTDTVVSNDKCKFIKASFLLEDGTLGTMWAHFSHDCAVEVRDDTCQ